MTFFKILIVGLINDIDNVVILSALLSKHYFKGIQLHTILLLSLSRTVFIYTLGKLINLPGFHLVTGMVILWLSLQLALYEPLPSKKRTTQTKRQIGQTLRLYCKKVLLINCTDPSYKSLINGQLLDFE